MPFISSAPGTRARALLDHALHRGIAIRIVLETPHREAIVPLILEGVGAAFLPRAVAQDAQRRGAVVLPLRPAVSYDVCLVHRDQPLTAAAEAFVTTALAYAPTIDSING